MANIVTGSYTSDGNARILQFGANVKYFELLNYTAFDSTATPGDVKRAWFEENMAAGSYMAVKNTDGAATDESIKGAADGFTLVDQGAKFGLNVSAFTNANPGVITVGSSAEDFGVVAGDTIVVAGIRETYDASKTTLNGEFTVASVSGTGITLVEDTSNYRVYSSGGLVYRKSAPTENVGKQGIQIGTDVVGDASDVVHYMAVIEDAS